MFWYTGEHTWKLPQRASQAEGRGFESRFPLQVFEAPTPTYGGGPFRGCNSLKPGAVRVPLGVVEIQEAEIRFLLSEGVGVDTQCQLGVSMTELCRHPLSLIESL